jgi:hypothetical protein
VTKGPVGCGRRLARLPSLAACLELIDVLIGN